MSALRSLLALVLVALAAPCVADGSRAAEIADEVRGLRLDPGGAVRVTGLRLRAGLASVTLADGFLVPSTPVAGRPVEFAFVGSGRIELEPPDEIEAGQLELFTGSSTLSEPFRRAVFVIALDAAEEAVRRAVPATAGDSESAETLYREWSGGPERRLLDVDARIFADGLGDPLAGGYFCGSFEGENLGSFLYVVDPLAYEQLILGQFVRPDLSRRDERKVRRSIERAQRKGKLIGLEIADLGTWDTWVSASLRSADGRQAPGSRGVEPNHYDIDASLSGPELAVEATATISLRTVVDGLTSVALEMEPDLEPVRVVDAVGRELGWLRSRNELVVALAEPVGVGGGLVLGVAYRGRPIDKVASGTFVQRDTTGWYPHAGTIDRATYQVTLRWPDRLDLAAPGKILDGGGDDGTRWRRWRLDLPAMGTSFELGRFERRVGSAAGVSIDVAVDRLGRQADRELAAEILATVTDAMEYFGEIFGPYPLDRLQIVSSPRSYSQGLLGFVTLSTAAVVDWDVWGPLLGLQDRRTVVAHELAHQWWGNLVGWRSYRDQWISEAMANYAAIQWARRRLAGLDDGGLVRGPTDNWQAELLRTTDDGRPIESLGPLVLGARLDSSISTDAYPAIVYKKGALILNMLSQLYTEETFSEILRSIVDVASGRLIATENLLDGIGRLSGIDLDWFARRYVYGTGLPEVDYRSTVEPLGDGRWAVTGEATQRPPMRYRYRVEELGAGVLDVRRSAEPAIAVADSVLVVPFQVGLGDEPAADDGRRAMLRGRLFVSGPSTPIHLELDREPEVFWLDRDQEVFGRFFSVDRWPRRTGYLRGLDLAAAGDTDAARTAFLEALGSEVAVVPAGWEDFFRDLDAEAEGERLDARIRLELARLALAEGRIGEAAIELARARDLVTGADRWLLGEDLLVVESRVDLLANDAQSAFKRLRRSVLGRRGADTPETWALLAVAARAVGDDEVFDQAVARARELGVDLGPLEDADGGSVTP